MRTTCLLLLLALAATGCEREVRPLRVEPPSADRIRTLRQTPLQPGVPTSDAAARRDPPVHNDYEDNAYAMSQGKRLFSYFNCVGCHAHGGGGMGPPLMDALWIYGSAPEQVFATIVEGRPNGMPSFQGRIPDYQVWQLVAYVRSMSGLVPFDAAPARADALYPHKPENSVEGARGPVQSFTPPGAEMPR